MSWISLVTCVSNIENAYQSFKICCDCSYFKIVNLLLVLFLSLCVCMCVCVKLWSYISQFCQTHFCFWKFLIIFYVSDGIDDGFLIIHFQSGSILYFFCLITLAGTLSTVLNRSHESRHVFTFSLNYNGGRTQRLCFSFIAPGRKYFVFHH